MIKVTATDSSQPPNTASFTVPVTVPSFTPQGPVCNFPSAPVPNGLSASVAVMCTAVTGDSIASVTVTFDVANSVSTTVQPPANTVTYGNTFTHTYPLGGTYNLTVSATDITGLASATPGTATVTVSAPQPPTCTLTVQGTGGLSVAALGTCQDQVSPISDLTVNFGDDTVAHGTGGALKVSQTFAHTYAVAGTYNVTLTGTNSIPLTSAPVSQSITVPSPLAISGPSQASVSPGGTVTYTVTLPLGFPDPNPPLTLSCAPNPPDTQLPAGIQCLFSPASIAPGQSSTLTIATNSTAPSTTAVRIPGMYGLGLALLPAMLLMGASARRSRSRKKTGTISLVAISLATALIMMLSACGTNAPPVASGAITPSGTYTVLVQVTDATQKVLGSNTVTLTVH
jgi:PKD repeat protein